MYRYEMHNHNCVGSLCGVLTPEEQVDMYADIGYSGIITTDHFIHGNTAIDRNLPWRKRMEGYYEAYLRMKKQAEKHPGFNVFFGLEHAFAGGREVLLYGLNFELLANHPELENMPIREFCKFMNKHGVLCVTAHPYRERNYNDNSVAPDPDFVNGVEVYNAANTKEENLKAVDYADKYGFFYTSGGDVHTAKCRIGDAGIATDIPITDIHHLVRILKSGKYKLIVHGEITDKSEIRSKL